MKKSIFYLSCVILFLGAGISLKAQTVQDTIVTDSIPTLPYDFNANQKGSLYLSDLENYEVIYDPQEDIYRVVTKIGDYEISYPVVMTPEEYRKYRLKKDMYDYYKGKISAISGKKKDSDKQRKNLLPKYYINSKFFETLFGSNEIDVSIQGNIEIKLGLLHQQIDNPQLSESNRKSTIFDFDQNIGASIAAKVGKRLKITTNYDTQSTFDFQNIIKLEFDPGIAGIGNIANIRSLDDVKSIAKQRLTDKTKFDEDGIIRKVEMGNISMPIRNSLINGAQNLFGLKTELQFGPTTIALAYAKQQSQSKTVRAEGGSVIQEFDLRASDYDPDRHFFLAQYFRDNFDNALENFPLISSSIQITNIELWITNTSRVTENVRNIVAVGDLGESVMANMGNPNINITTPLPNFIPENTVNELNSIMVANGVVRNISTVANAFVPLSPTMAQGRDYSVLENAHRLVENIDFQLDRQLGFISLNRKLAESDVLAVAFEYTINGSDKVYKVGELSSDGIVAPDNLVVKLLRSELVITDMPLWKLMMKNIYYLQAYQLQEEGFRLELLYANDDTGVPLNVLQTSVTNNGEYANKTLLNLFYIDRLDQNDVLTPEGDGYFDYVPGITVQPLKGYMMFPKVQPFGSYIGNILTDIEDEHFVFDELYEYTQQEVKDNYQQKDKYQIRGYFKSDSAQGISLGAFNVPRGSVHVTSGGRELVEGVDYVVDYQIGRVKIINPSIEASNAPIQVSVEQNSVFSQQRRSFLGVDIEHKFSDNFVMGASYLNLREQPFTNKVFFGQDPIRNNVFGLNASYSNEAPILTKWVNKLPFTETDVASNFSVRGDVAYLLTGSPRSIDINGYAAVYVDDFEGSQIPLDIRSQQFWFLASTPQGQTDPHLVNLGGDATTLDYGKQRARLAWYNIDNDLHGGSGKPDNITNDELSREEVRRIRTTELFPNDELDLSESNIIRTLDLAYYPSERGQYNFDTSNVNQDGTFSNPEDRWGGITRPLTITDFENSNIEYIQFWMMDPYENYSITNEEGLPAGVDPQNPKNQIGELYFNLGNISEDILKDNRKMFENGLPEEGGTNNTEPTIWGKIPTNQSLLNAFDDSDEHRIQQDIGLDGLSDLEETEQFADFISSLPTGAQAQAMQDPSSDNFQYFKGGELDNQQATILQRYKNYNRTQKNSPTANLSPESYPTAATQYPDTEDINRDQTMSTVESYYQYRVSLDKANLNLESNNYIVDTRTITNTLPNGSSRETTWYQFRVPIAGGEAINGISGFHSIRFMRMFLTRFKMPVVLRFGQIEMVRGEWRRYKYTLDDGTLPLTGSELDNYESGVVNIEENDTRQPIPYVLPPGIERERLQGSTTVQLQNEQSLVLKVNNLESEKGRSLFKNVLFDMRLYKRLQMFIHAESRPRASEVQDDELLAILRIGSDLSENYYQIEQPLKITPPNSSSAIAIWPQENELNVDLEALKKLKLERFEAGAVANVLYPESVPGEEVTYRIRVKGNPNLGNIKTIMLGVKNKASAPRSAEIWFNELRVSEFDNEGGWAAVVTADANFADLMDVSVTGRMSTQGYGNVDQSVNERSQENIKQYDLVSSINAGKILPQNWGLQLPLNFSVSEEIRDPKYDAQYQDILLKDTNIENSPHRNDAQDYTKRTGISLINFKKNRNPNSTKKQRFYDVENLAFSYVFNEVYHRDYNVKKFLDQNVRASAGYAYSFKPLAIEPFKNSKSLNKKFLKPIKDLNFNFMPSDVSVNSNIIRNYNEQLSRSLVQGLPELPTLKQRNFLFDWDYKIGYKPTKSIRLDFRALNNHVYDDFSSTDDLTLYQNFFNTGRPIHYHQTLEGSYQIPIDKIRLFRFINSNYTYKADFDWQGASTSYIEQIGNNIQNANTHNLSVNLDMNKFYKDFGITKLLRTKSQRAHAKRERERAKKKKNKNETSETPAKETKVAKAKTGGQKISRGIYSVLTALKKVRFSYFEENGTILPGYIPEVGLLGRDNYSGSLAPTLGFVFGSQVDIRNKALEEGWLIVRNLDDPEDRYYNKIYARTYYNKLDVQATLTPFKDFDIELNANKIYTRNTSEQIDAVRDNINATPRFRNSLSTETGNFSMSYFMLGTSFADSDKLFQQFKENRAAIAQRLADNSGLDPAHYGSTSQQVVLPAFLSAYSGTSANKINLNPFRNVPLPNWSINYRGFMKFKWFKKHFSSFSISHAYRSSYTIANFSNNLQYDPANPEALDISGNYLSKRLFTNIGLIEEFSPLVKVDVKFKNSLSVSARINRDRLLTLNFNNNTMAQNNGTEYVVGLGYRIKDVPFSFRLQGKKQKFKGDINIKLDVSYRNDLMMIRYFGEENDTENDQITGGQKIFNLRLMADYNLNKNLQAGFYYIQDASKYAISTTYPRKSISSGISIKYSLGN